MTFIIVCGGTAGHINPGLAIAEGLRERLPEAEIVFIGAGRDMEKRLIPEAGFPLINIKMTGIKRGFKPKDVLYNIKTLIYLISAESKAKKIFREKRPDAVIGTGGYICYPVLRAAKRLKIPALIHESNAKPGMTVRMLSKSADKVMVTYPGYEQYYKHPERVVLTGTPLRRGFYDPSGFGGTVFAGGKTGSDKPLVVSFWGSLGAEKMNGIMAEFIKRNVTEQSFYHIHAAGNSKEVLDSKLKDTGASGTQPPYADIRGYISNMPEVMNTADLVICRAGAATLAEIAYMGKPCILVPSPYVPENVQYENAKQLSDHGAAVLLEEHECSGEMLYNTACEIINNKPKLAQMAHSLKLLAKPEATKKTVEVILSETENKPGAYR